jgi:phage protein U
MFLNRRVEATKGFAMTVVGSHGCVQGNWVVESTSSFVCSQIVTGDRKKICFAQKGKGWETPE